MEKTHCALSKPKERWGTGPGDPDACLPGDIFRTSQAMDVGLKCKQAWNELYTCTLK